MCINPNAKLTPGTCFKCGAEIPGFYAVQWCDGCIDEHLAESKAEEESDEP